MSKHLVVAHRRRAPASHVLDAFGVARGSLEALEGGQHMTWRAADLVLKPGIPARLQAWLASVAERVRPAGGVGGGFRFATPAPALDGRWVVGGWTATRWMEGEHRPGELPTLLATSAAFHEAVARGGIEVPVFLRSRTDRWAVADRVAWGEEARPRFASAEARSSLERLAPLMAGRWRGPAPQLIHGDLAANVLVDPSGALPPAVIDLAPYQRPAGLPDAIVVVDAVTWHGVPVETGIGYLAGSPFGCELLARAVAFRLVSEPDHAAAYQPLVDALVGR